jgi:hypothetical protein
MRTPSKVRVHVLVWRTWFAFCRCWRHRVTRRVWRMQLNTYVFHPIFCFGKKSLFNFFFVLRMCSSRVNWTHSEATEEGKRITRQLYLERAYRWVSQVVQLTCRWVSQFVQFCSWSAPVNVLSAHHRPLLSRDFPAVLVLLAICSNTQHHFLIVLQLRMVFRSVRNDMPVIIGRYSKAIAYSHLGSGVV